MTSLDIPTAALEPVTRMLLDLPPIQRPRPRVYRGPRAAVRSPFGVAFTAWLASRRISRDEAATWFECSVATIHTWTRRALPLRRFWPALRAAGIDPEPYYTRPRRVTRPPADTMRAFAAALCAWLDETGLDLVAELDVTPESVRLWRRGRHMPQPATVERMREMGLPRSGGAV